jgi:hypothetical protein
MGSRKISKTCPGTYGPTVTVTLLLVTLSDVAVMFVVPTATAVTRPVVSMVAAAVSLELHAATSVMTCGPLHVAAVATNGIVSDLLAEIVPGFVGVIAIDEIHPTVTVPVAVAVRPCASAVIVVVVRD